MKRILAYIPETRVLDLERSLREYEVTFDLAQHGADILEKAITRSYDAVLFWETVPVLERNALLGLLRNNPKLSNRPIFVAEENASAARLGQLGEICLPEEMNKDAILRILKELKISVDFDPEQTYGLGESYDQIPLIDFLQIIEQNRKTGRLVIEGSGTGGLIYFDNGKPIRAELDNGIVSGNKAFFRLVSLEHASLHFKETRKLPEEKNLNFPLQHLIMESMRIQDELEDLQKDLGDMRAYEVAIPSPEQLAELTGDQRNLLLLVQYHEDFQRVLDFSVQDDATVLRNYKSLVDKGIILASIRNTDELTADELGILHSLDRLEGQNNAILLHAPTPDYVAASYRAFERVGALDLRSSHFVPDRAQGSVFVLRGETTTIHIVCADEHTLYRRILGNRLQIVGQIDRPEKSGNAHRMQVALTAGTKRYLSLTWDQEQTSLFWREVLTSL